MGCPPGSVSPQPVWWPQNASRGPQHAPIDVCHGAGPIRWPEGCRKISKIGWGAWPREIAQPTQLPRLTFRWLSVRMITPAWVLLLPSISGYRAASECPPRRCSSLQLPSRSHNGFARGQITASETETAGPEAGSRRARASDIFLTRDPYKLEPGWACRAEPRSSVGDVPPRLGAALFPRLCCATRRRCGGCGGSCCDGSGRKSPQNQGRCGIACPREDGSGRQPL